MRLWQDKQALDASAGRGSTGPPTTRHASHLAQAAMMTSSTQPDGAHAVMTSHASQVRVTPARESALEWRQEEMQARRKWRHLKCGHTDASSSFLRWQELIRKLWRHLTLGKKCLEEYFCDAIKEKMKIKARKRNESRSYKYSHLTRYTTIMYSFSLRSGLVLDNVRYT